MTHDQWPTQTQAEDQQRSAEWCQHDDLTLHGEVDGMSITARVKIAGLTMKEVMKDWSHAGMVRLVGGPAHALLVRVVGPPCKWRVEHIVGNQNFALTATPQAEYTAGETVDFVLQAA